MRQTIAIRSLFLAFLVSAPLPASQDGGESSRVRTADGRIRLAIQYGLDRSARFRSLNAAIESSDVVIYLEDGRCNVRESAGCILFAGATKSARYVRVRVDPKQPLAKLVPMIAHELQHAVEIAHAPEVVDFSTLARLYHLRPASFSWQARNSIAMVHAGELGHAARSAARANRLLTREEYTIDPFSAAWVAVFPAGEAWLQNDVRRALIAVDTAASAIEAVPASARYQYASQVGLMYATLGRFTRAEEVLGFIPDQKERTFALGHVRGAQDDPTVIREFLVRYYPDIDEARGLVSLFVEAGLLGAARTLAAWHKRPSSQSGADYIALQDGQLALADGRVDDAIELLDRFMQLNFLQGGPSWSRAARKLAVAWRTKGDLPRAIQTLERASVERRASITGWSAGSAWISLRADLAEAYRQAGRIPEAETVEAELLTLLDVADADHAVKTRLLRTRGATGSPRKP
jgi:tetratricopeptide (TPR) repeat protein